MGRKSSISRLPSEIRERISSLRDQGRTIDEIMAQLDALDVDVSRSALGRHVKKMDQVAREIRRSRELAEAVSRQFGDKETSQVARTNIEILHSLMMKLMIGEEDQEEVVLDPKDAMFLATALEKASKASKLDLDRMIAAAREEEKMAATEKAAETAVKTAKQQGLSAQTVEAIKASILGVDT